MESKPSFWLFYSSINRKTMLGEPLRVYDRKKNETTVYDDNLYLYKGTFRVLTFLATFLPACMSLQVRTIIMPLGLMRNMIFELILLELTIVFAIYFAVLYYKAYLRFNFTVIEKIKEKKMKVVGIISVILLIIVFTFLIVNSFSVSYIRSMLDKNRDNIENIEVIVDLENSELLIGDDIRTGVTSYSNDKREGYILVELEISKTPLPVSAFLDNTELKLKRVKDKGKLYFFWEGNRYSRRFFTYIPISEIENKDTLNVFCGGIEKTWTINIDK